ncbi:MAG: ABC transporter substrate-binding protein [Eubacteriales bacterium]|nr:ABC transporter substrate-binding protein [Eubacteriales bacterium]
MKMSTKKMALTGFAAAMAVSAGMTAYAKEEVYKIGVCEQSQHLAISQATEGFKDALIEKFGERVSFDVQNAGGDLSNCTMIINSFISENVDLIMANATNAFQAAVAGTADIPILGTSVTDYAAALDLDEWTGIVGTNVSGTSDCAPLSEQADMIMELLPDAKSIGILYCSAEPNSVYQAAIIEDCLTESGCAAEIKQYTFTDTNDIASVVTNAAEKCDVIYIPTDNTAASNAEIINNICEPAGIPVITGEENTCKVCGIATLTIDYYELGYETGEMAVEILENKADISEMPVQYAGNVTKKYVPERCETLGITVPDGYEAVS